MKTRSNKNGNLAKSSAAAPARVVDPKTLREMTELIGQQEQALRQGGGQAGHARQRKLGRLPVRERLERLLDPGSPVIELNLWAGFEMYPDAGDVPAAGVVTGVGYVQERPVVFVANDATVKAGAFFPATSKKVLRAQRVAMRCNLPLVYLVDSAGVYLPMQDEIFPDEDDFGRIFRNNAVISAMGIPQFAAVMGNCVAGGAYLPVLSDKILMTAGSELYLAGPALVKAAIGQVTSAEELGGAKMHAQISGTVDFYEENDESCLDRLRQLIDLLPIHDRPAASAPDPARPGTDLYEIVSLDGRKEYDARHVLDCVVDRGSMHEYKHDYGQTLVCAYAAIAGRKIGIVASQRLRRKAPSGELQIGGVIYHDSADKAARFIWGCDAFNIPLVFLADVPGFMIGSQVERQGIIRHGAKMVTAVSEATVPKVSVIVRKAYGAGLYAMSGPAFEPDATIALPTAKIAVMGPEAAVNAVYANRIAAIEDPEERETFVAEQRRLYEEDVDLYRLASGLVIDGVVEVDQLRHELVHRLELARSKDRRFSDRRHGVPPV